MPINRHSNLDPNSLRDPLGSFYTKLGDLDKKINQKHVESVKGIAHQKLSEMITPENFVRKYSTSQRDQILKDQFFNKISSSELKPYLLADREYLVSHFRNEDLVSKQVSNDESPPDSIPNEFYYDYEEIEKNLKIPIQFIKNQELAAVLKEINPEILRNLKTLDLNQCVSMTNLSSLQSTQFDHLHALNCSSMRGLKTLDGVPNKCHYREINLKDCSNLQSLAPLEGLSIKKLNLDNCFHLTDLTPLTKIKNLEVINISSCMKARPTPENLDALEMLKSQGVHIHAEIHTMLPWLEHKSFFEETIQTEKLNNLKI